MGKHGDTTVWRMGWITFAIGVVLAYAAFAGLGGMDRSGVPFVQYFAQWWILWLGVAAIVGGLILVIAHAITHRRRQSVGWITLVTGMVMTYACLQGMVSANMPVVRNVGQWWILWLGIAAIVGGLVLVITDAIAHRRRQNIGWITFAIGVVLAYAAFAGLGGMDRSGVPFMQHFAQWWILWLGVVAIVGGLILVIAHAIAPRRRPAPAASTS